MAEKDAVHPDFVLYASRMASFSNWPMQIIQKPKKLCEAGFFYEGKSDEVTCFWCGVIVGRWHYCDTSLNRHRKASPDCAYISMTTANEVCKNYDEVDNRDSGDDCVGPAKRPRSFPYI